MISRNSKIKSSVQTYLNYWPKGDASFHVLRRTSLLRRSLSMSNQFQKAARFVSLPLIAILLASVAYLTFVENAQAGLGNGRSESRTDKVSPLMKSNSHRADEKVTVILSLNGPRTERRNALLAQNGVQQRREMKNVGSISLTLPFRMVAELASLPEVAHISSNEVVRAMGHVSATTGTEAGQAAAVAASRGTIDGSGVGIAILDSGIDANHAQFASGSGSRVVASVDFTGENRIDDPYGHGTFVAAAAAGGTGAGSAYKGIATGVSLFNVRVLDSEGAGTVESVLDGLDWVAAHARDYNIRIVNLSLGGRGVVSYKYDPLCRAVRGLVNSGIVVFAAAGNDGKDADDEKIYGAIHTPGNEPSAFTIGASNTFQTDSRSDDAVTTYSSRGPTRSYWVDENAVTHHDNLLKPDLVAPGNKLVFAQAHDNYLISQNPTLNQSTSGTGATLKVMQMSGTSVSTPIAAGAAALMLQLNPKLTPNMVKAFMEYSAQKLSGFGTLEQGAGELNVDGAMRLAMLARQDLTSPVQVGTSLLTGSVTASSSFCSTSFNWSATIVRKFNTMTGSSLVERF